MRKYKTEAELSKILARELKTSKMEGKLQEKFRDEAQEGKVRQWLYLSRQTNRN